MPAISRPILAFFRSTARRYFRRQFHAVRARNLERFTHPGRPLIVYANHGSWWDPMVSVLLAAERMSERRHYAPMDADALKRYVILRSIGIFPVEMHTARGAAQFLRTGKAILESGGVLWVTPQGRFADPRQRPLDFKPGLAALAAKVEGGCTLLPLAIEYPFWDERLPETLLHFGEPVHVAPGEQDIQLKLESALLVAMDELKTVAIARDPRAFTTLRQGSAGAGGFYALGKRLAALLGRRPYIAEHTPLPEAPE
ncbi:lysophospholipid acyltransferase family protein [Granulicella rosea]|uniref:lysophospholipid acyltransferase family protein n=1 Tax=Granulicella rosea TaxID=474952 RepID=UPI001C3E65B9|nr:lysophospholipid acyltransferase family protein [Granulicella rosea]